MVKWWRGFLRFIPNGLDPFSINSVRATLLIIIFLHMSIIATSWAQIKMLLREEAQSVIRTTTGMEVSPWIRLKEAHGPIDFAESAPNHVKRRVKCLVTIAARTTPNQITNRMPPATLIYKILKHRVELLQAAVQLILANRGLVIRQIGAYRIQVAPR